MRSEKGAMAHDLEITVNNAQVVHVLEAARDSRNLASEDPERSRVNEGEMKSQLEWKRLTSSDFFASGRFRRYSHRLRCSMKSNTKENGCFLVLYAPTKGTTFE